MWMFISKCAHSASLPGACGSVGAPETTVEFCGILLSPRYFENPKDRTSFEACKSHSESGRVAIPVTPVFRITRRLPFQGTLGYVILSQKPQKGVYETYMPNNRGDLSSVLGTQINWKERTDSIKVAL